MVVAQVVAELMKRLAHKTTETIRGAINRNQRTHRPRPADIDWPRTIRANLHNWQADYQTIVPETLVGHARKSKAKADLDHVIMCVDQSGSMASFGRLCLDLFGGNGLASGPRNKTCLL